MVNQDIKRLAEPSQIIVAMALDDCNVLLPHAIAQAKACGAHLTLVHALMNAGIPALDWNGFNRLEDSAREKMEELIARVKAEGISCTGEIAQTYSPEDALSQAARRFRGERVIMATHGRGRMGQIMLGSVAHELLNFFDIPIFAVGPKAGVPAQHCSPKKILHPVSFSTRYQETVEFTLALADLYGAELMLLHVQDPDGTNDGDPAQILELTKRSLSPFLVPMRSHIAYGNVVDEVLNTAAVFGADWIVLGTNPLAASPMSYTPLRANSTAYRLMAAANIPVITFPHLTKANEIKVEDEERPTVAY